MCPSLSLDRHRSSPFVIVSSRLYLSYAHLYILALRPRNACDVRGLIIGHLFQYINTTRCLGPYSQAPPSDRRLSFGRPGVDFGRILPDPQNTKKRVHPNISQNHTNPALVLGGCRGHPGKFQTAFWNVPEISEEVPAYRNKFTLLRPTRGTSGRRVSQK